MALDVSGDDRRRLTGGQLVGHIGAKNNVESIGAPWRREDGVGGGGRRRRRRRRRRGEAILIDSLKEYRRRGKVKRRKWRRVRSYNIRDRVTKNLQR